MVYNTTATHVQLSHGTAASKNAPDTLQQLQFQLCFLLLTLPQRPMQLPCQQVFLLFPGLLGFLGEKIQSHEGYYMPGQDSPQRWGGRHSHSCDIKITDAHSPNLEKSFRSSAQPPFCFNHPKSLGIISKQDDTFVKIVPSVFY